MSEQELKSKTWKMDVFNVHVDIICRAYFIFVFYTFPSVQHQVFSNMLGCLAINFYGDLSESVCRWMM